MRRFCKREDGNRGSLTVEAILFLIPFMCAFLTLVNAARFVQSEMLIHHAITQTAKQISTYSYIATKTGITAQMQATNKKSSEFKTETTNVYQSVTDFVGALGDLGDGDDLLGGIEDAIDKGEAAGTAVYDYFSDPKEIMYGALAVVKSKGERLVTTWAVGAIARGYIKKSIAKVSDDPDEYLKTVGIVDGMSGLDFSASKWNSTESGKGDIEIVVTYKLKNLLFPDFDFGEYECRQCVSTLNW